MKVALIVIFSCIGIISYTQNVEPQLATEHLNYTIYFKAGFIWVAIGEMSLNTSVYNERTHIQLKAKTFKKWKSLHEVEFDINAVYNNQSGFSESYLRRSIENGIYIKDSIEFDQTNLHVKEIVEESGETRKEYSIPLKHNAVDILTSLQLLRSQLNGINVNEQLATNLFYSKYEYDFLYTVESIELKKIKKIGKRECMLISTNSIGGRFFSGKSKLQMWMSTDELAIPYMFETPFKFGKIRVVINK